MTNKNKEVKKEVKKTNKKIVDISQELLEIKNVLLEQERRLLSFNNRSINSFTDVKEELKVIKRNFINVDDGIVGTHLKSDELQKLLNNKFKCLIYALTANLVIGSIILLNILFRGWKWKILIQLIRKMN